MTTCRKNARHGIVDATPSGPVYLDANGFIYSVERIEPYRTLLEPMWRLDPGRAV